MAIIRDIGVGFVIFLFLVIGMSLALYSYRREGQQHTANISDDGKKNPNHIEVTVKVLSIDPIKGDVTTRLEFFQVETSSNRMERSRKMSNLIATALTGNRRLVLKKESG